MKAKLGAARVVVHRELGCAGAYTLEASLGGRLSVRQHFGVSSYIEQGALLCRGIAELAGEPSALHMLQQAETQGRNPWFSTVFRQVLNLCRHPWVPTLTLLLPAETQAVEGKELASLCMSGNHIRTH
jgi:hypothetical protein